MKTTFTYHTINAESRKLVACSLFLFTLLFLSSCKKDNPIPATDSVKEILKANIWKMTSVTVDNTDKTAVYSGLTLGFTDTNYSTTNGGVVWPANGTWAFADATGKLITRSDGLAISVEEATTTKLSLKLTWAAPTLGGGRASSVAGVHVFVFGK